MAWTSWHNEERKTQLCGIIPIHKTSNFQRENFFLSMLLLKVLSLIRQVFIWRIEYTENYFLFIIHLQIPDTKVPTDFHLREDLKTVSEPFSWNSHRFSLYKMIRCNWERMQRRKCLYLHFVEILTHNAQIYFTLLFHYSKWKRLLLQKGKKKRNGKGNVGRSLVSLNKPKAC